MPAPATHPSSGILDEWGCALETLPDEDRLRALHRAWLDHVPFENITKLIHSASPGSRGSTRSLTEFWSDHRRWNSGGTCFDSAAAFHGLLASQGFSPEFVFCHLPGKGVRSHVALLVTLEKTRWLVDIGYALPEPVPIPKSQTIRRRTLLYDVEIRRGPEAEFLIFTEDGRGLRFRYSFEPVAATPADFERAWLDTFREGAPYMSRLALGRFRGPVRYIYKNTSSLYVLSRQEQKLAPVPEPAVPWLSDIFGIHPELLEAGMALVAEPAKRRERAGSDR